MSIIYHELELMRENVRRIGRISQLRLNRVLSEARQAIIPAV